MYTQYLEYTTKNVTPYVSLFHPNEILLRNTIFQKIYILYTQILDSVYSYRFLISSHTILWNIQFIEKDVCRKVEMSENPAIVTNAQLEAIFIQRTRMWINGKTY